jgi:hypothetical protein
MYDRKVVAAATASGMFALFAVMAALRRLVMGLKHVGLL